MTNIQTNKLTQNTIDFLRRPNTGCDWAVPRGRVNLVRENGRWVMRGPSGTHSIADDGNDERLMAHFNNFLWHNLALVFAPPVAYGGEATYSGERPYNP